MAGVVGEDRVEETDGLGGRRGRRCEPRHHHQPQLAVRVPDVAQEHVVAHGRRRRRRSDEAHDQRRGGRSGLVQQRVHRRDEGVAESLDGARRGLEGCADRRGPRRPPERRPRRRPGPRRAPRAGPPGRRRSAGATRPPARPRRATRARGRRCTRTATSGEPAALRTSSASCRRAGSSPAAARPASPGSRTAGSGSPAQHGQVGGEPRRRHRSRELDAEPHRARVAAGQQVTRRGHVVGGRFEAAAGSRSRRRSQRGDERRRVGAVEHDGRPTSRCRTRGW